MDVRWLLGIVGVYVLIVVVDWFRARKKKRLRYAVKRTTNDLRWLTHMVGAMYFIIGGVTLLPSVVDWAVNYLAVHPEWAAPNVSHYAIVGAPVVYVVAILSIAVWVVSKGFQPWIKYNEQELVWEKEGSEKFRGRLRRLFRRKGANK